MRSPGSHSTPFNGVFDEVLIMTVKFLSGPDASINPRGKRSNGHTKPAAPLIDLDGHGRLRVANLLALFGFSHSTLYTRIRSGDFPSPDGHDGRNPYWRTSTIRSLL